MRHRKKVNHLGRTSSHRKAMLANMASSLILHKKITTTTAKAKALRSYVEPLLTKSKDDSTHSRRVVFTYLQDKVAVSELFREVSPKIAQRPGGYTRILKIGNRLGDSAEMSIIELVDFNDARLAATSAEATKAGRTRRGGVKKKADEPVAQTAAPAKPVLDETSIPAEVIEETALTQEPDAIEQVADSATEDTAATDTAQPENEEDTKEKTE